MALVTGSSQGLGRVIAARLARDGLSVAVNGIHDDQVDAVVTAIRSAGGTAAGFVADVTDEDRVGELVASIGSALGPVDVLVVNATGPQPNIALADTTWRDHLDQLEFFVKSPVLLGLAVLPGMRRARVGADRPHRLRGGRPAAAAPLGVRDGQGGAGRPGPVLGTRAGT